MKPTSEILERIYKNASDHKDGVYTRLYRYLLREDIYFIAYQKLYSNKGATTMGTDADTADGFGKKYVEGLINDLKNGTYKPKPARRIYIPKSNGKERPLSIPSFRDKLLQEVIRMFLEAIYEPNFSEFSHGFLLPLFARTYALFLTLHLLLILFPQSSQTVLFLLFHYQSDGYNFLFPP